MKRSASRLHYCAVINAVEHFHSRFHPHAYFHSSIGSTIPTAAPSAAALVSARGNVRSPARSSPFRNCPASQRRFRDPGPARSLPTNPEERARGIAFRERGLPVKSGGIREQDILRGKCRRISAGTACIFPRRGVIQPFRRITNTKRAAASSALVSPGEITLLPRGANARPFPRRSRGTFDGINPSYSVSRQTWSLISCVELGAGGIIWLVCDWVVLQTYCYA